MSAAQTFIPAVPDNDDLTFADAPAFHYENTALGEPAATGDWPVAIKLVERAAMLIKDYEQKLRTLEEDTREYMLRTTAEQEKSSERIRELQDQVEQLESAMSHTSDDLRETRIEASETKAKLQNSEARLAEATAEIKLNTSYLQRVESMLGAI